MAKAALGIMLSVCAIIICIEMFRYNLSSGEVPGSHEATRQGVATPLNGNGIEVTVTSAKTLISGEKNIIEVDVINKGDVAAVTSPLNEFQGVRVIVTRDGKEVTRSALNHVLWDPRYAIYMRFAAVQLFKGGEIKVQMNLTRLYDLSLEGEYQLQAVWEGFAEIGYERIRCVSKVVHFDVSDHVPNKMSGN